MGTGSKMRETNLMTVNLVLWQVMGGDVDMGMGPIIMRDQLDDGAHLHLHLHLHL